MGLTNQIGASSLIRPGVIDNAAARPASPFEGQCIFQKDTDQLLVWNGTAWVIPNQTTTNPNGLELIKTQTVGTSVASVSVTDAFSSTYDDYRVMYMGGTGSGASSMSLTLTGSTASYYAAVTGANYTGGTSSINDNNASSWSFAGIVTTNFNSLDVNLYGPFLTRRTGMQISGRVDMRTDGASFIGGGWHNVAASYTGFTIASSQNMTGGTIRVYGYRNS
jgi:hypothetical protein